MRLNLELGPLRKEVRKLRDETGQFVIDDPEKIHAIQLATDYPLAWKWRVYIPAGRSVCLAHQNFQIPKGELPQTNAGPYLTGPKELVITLKLDKEPDGRWRSGISYEGLTQYQIFPDDATTWLVKGSSGYLCQGVSRTVTVQQASEPLVLLRQRVFYDKGGAVPPENEPAQTDGLLVWLGE